MYKKLIFIVIVLFTIISCNKKSYDPGATSTVKASNEWWVNLYLDGAPQYGKLRRIRSSRPGCTHNRRSSSHQRWAAS